MANYQQLIKEGHYQKVVEEATVVLKKDSYNTEALIWLGKAQYKLEQFDLAIESYNKLINLLPNIADLYADRGLCFHMAGEIKSAISDFDKAVELEPNNAYRYSCRAFVKDFNKDYQGALNDYNKAIELDPKDAITHNNKGVLEEKLGFAAQAQESFTVSNQLQGIDLDKELAKINTSELPKITRSETPVQIKKLSANDYFKVVKSVFTTRKGLGDFVKFLMRKKS